ncbi:MAG: redoxin domain-containing protein [Microcoleus sp. SIO2G3]|nr:redoxin domain-containing protein [Microcoleus sp. SIO2G3]
MIEISRGISVGAVNEETFTQEVLEASSPVLVSFWAPWCGVCRLIYPLLNQLQGDWNGQLKLVSINADENLKLASTYRLATLPTVLLFDRGQLLHRLDQFHTPADIHTAAQGLATALEKLKANYLPTP